MGREFTSCCRIPEYLLPVLSQFHSTYYFISLLSVKFCELIYCELLFLLSLVLTIFMLSWE